MIVPYVIDITKSPIPPPTRKIRELLFSPFGYETKESKEQTRLWNIYIEAYGDALREERKKQYRLIQETIIEIAKELI
jgi:hypothetical protein